LIPEKITWTSFGIDARVLMPEGTWVSGFADETVTSLKEGDVIQFECHKIANGLIKEAEIGK